MLLLIAAVVLGLLFALVSTQNTQGVMLRLGDYGLTNIPLYLVVFGSILVGLFLSWVLSLFGWVSTRFTLHGKDVHIKHSEKMIDSLKSRVHDVELENAKLRGDEVIDQPSEDAPSEHVHRPNIFRKVHLLMVDQLPHPLEVL